MKSSLNQICLALALLVFGSAGVFGQQTNLHQVTLFSRIAHKDFDYGRSAYNFYAFARSDRWPKLIKNRAHLTYGSFSLNGNTDWFAVSMGGHDSSRIKDLGAMNWSELVSAPALPGSPHESTAIRPPRKGESSSSDGRLTKVVAGHVYVIRIKNTEEDFYVMLKVDSLDSNDHCALSWKIVPSPTDGDSKSSSPISFS